MFNQRAYENTRPDGIPVLEVVGEKERLNGEPRLFVPLKRSELRGEVAGPLAALRLVQVYGYSAAQCDKVLEALYRFPLPGDAAVTGVLVRFGDVEITAELKDRKCAEADYDQAKEKGQQAALASRESPDVFTLRVAGLRPGQDVTVETSYVQLARAQGAGWTLRVPLTTSPRYVRSDEVDSRPAQGQPLAVLRDPGHRFVLDVLVRGAAHVSSPTHELVTSPVEGGLRVGLKAGEVLPDRDCVLAWLPGQQPQWPTLSVMLHEDLVDGHAYFLALVAPPATRPEDMAAAREAILLVDHSGSMEGAKWQAADWAVKQFLSGLTERDSFALGVFHNTTTWFSNVPKRASGRELERAISFLESHRDSGGTELGVALEQALSLRRERGTWTRHLLVVTDAEVSDEGRILRLADQEASQQDRRRISVLCIDAAPNAFLAGQLAERGGGVARFLTSAPEEEDITTALDEVLADWAEPVLVGLRLEVDRPGLEAAGQSRLVDSASGSSAMDLGDLPAGRAVWTCGRVPLEVGRPLTFRLATADGQEVAQVTSPVEVGAAQGAALRALFGARRVVGLEYLISSAYPVAELTDLLQRLGYDPVSVFGDKASGKARVYAENVRKDANEALRGLLVSEALHYGLASSETAFVAVRKEQGKPVEASVIVANALPAGWSGRFALAAPPPGSHVAARGAPAAFRAPTAPRYARMSAPPSAVLYQRKASGLREAEPVPEAATKVVFVGRPVFVGGEAVLLDNTRSDDAAKLPAAGTLVRLELRFVNKTPLSASLDAGLAILIYVDDLSSPRARVRVADLVRQGLKRPLNLAFRSGQMVRLVLTDPNGAWASGAPAMEISLAWE